MPEQYKPLNRRLTEVISAAFTAAGYDSKYGSVKESQRPDLCDFQCNSAFEAARVYKLAPPVIAAKVAEQIKNDLFSEVTIAGNGYINLKLSNAFLACEVEKTDDFKQYHLLETPKTIILDYGGPNIAKPLHVGHLRSAIIGESLKRLGRFIGHKVTGDVHLGDWGLQMGMVILGLIEAHPELSGLENNDIPADFSALNITVEVLNDLYPEISKRCKADEALLKKAQKITAELQNGHPGYQALWKYFIALSINCLKKDYAVLSINFDLWLGESSVEDLIPGLIDRLIRENYAFESEGALVIDVTQPDDKTEIPPLIVKTSNDAVLYGTTDLATLQYRMEHFQPDEILYVVDNRQEIHFKQVFRAAKKTGIVPEKTVLEHIGFGTMNSKDGKPFKTREGGVMRLTDLIRLIHDKAKERIREQKNTDEAEVKDTDAIALKIGLAALKFADLYNQPIKNYVFDPDKFCAFEGKTGAYILYAVSRIKSIIRKAQAQGINVNKSKIIPPQSDEERKLMLILLDFLNTAVSAFENRQPNIMAEYLYQLASQFSSFYYTHHILREKNLEQQASWLTLCLKTLEILELGFSLLGIDSVDEM